MSINLSNRIKSIKKKFLKRINPKSRYPEIIFVVSIWEYHSRHHLVQIDNRVEGGQQGKRTLSDEAHCVRNFEIRNFSLGRGN